MRDEKQREDGEDVFAEKGGSMRHHPPVKSKPFQRLAIQKGRMGRIGRNFLAYV